MNILNMPVYFIMGVSILLSLILTVVNKLIVDQDRMKEIQKHVTSYNKKLMKATREQDQETLKDLEKDKPHVMQMQQEMMRMQMPMFASMLPFFVVFYLLKALSDRMAWGAFVSLPFNLPVLGIGDSFTWLGWYILCSLPFTSLFRKMFGVH